MVLLRIVSGFFAALAVFAASGRLVHQSTAHAVGWLAASVLLYVVSTIPTERLP